MTYDFDETRQTIIRMLNQDHELLRPIQDEIDRLKSIDELERNIVKLSAKSEWRSFELTTLLSKFGSRVDIPFVKLMLRFEKDKLRYSAVSMCMMWSTLKAVGESTILSYLYYPDLRECRTLITGDTILTMCRLNRETLSELSGIINGTRPFDFEMRLRSLLGVSQASDLRLAWPEWCRANHPDKGGDDAKFAEASAAHDEWLRQISNSKETES